MMLEGKDIPQHLLENKFDELGCLVWFWHAYCDLQSCRPTGSGPASIPWTAIFKYASEFLKLDEDALSEFIFFIRSLDQTWLDWANSKVEKDIASSKAKSMVNRNRE